MKWVRCPKCRTVNDIDRYPMCDGCDADLSDATVPTSPRRTPAVRRQAQQDSSAGRTFLIVLGILSGLALLGMLLTPGEQGKCGFFFVGFPALGLLFWFALARQIHASQSHVLIKLFLYIASAGVACFGALILVFLVCAAGGMRTGG